MKYTKEMIQEKIATDVRWLERGVLAIWKRQTRDEKVNETTNHFNGVGFNGTDGHIMTSFGNQLNRGRHLSEKQIYIARKKMPKYAGQLLKVIQENETEKSQAAEAFKWVNPNGLSSRMDNASVRGFAMINHGRY